MNPDLVCKIQVQTTGGKTARGSGYPITPNRIITAAHVVADAMRVESDSSAGDARDITLSFGVSGKDVPGSVYIEWSDAGIDVAVLRCELPAELQPAHKLLATPPNTPIKWFAQGYTDFGKRMRPGGKDGYEGTLTKFSESEATVALGCDAGLIDSKQWAGGSGSVAFDSATAQTALAVITDYESGKKLDHLVAVPLCYLLNSETTRDGFSRAIQFETYQRRKSHYEAVMSVIVENLKALKPEPLQKIAKEIHQLAGADFSGIKLDSNNEMLARQVAVCLVDYKAVTDVSGCLARLRRSLEHEYGANIDIIINHLLPLNYAPQVIHHLAEQVTGNRFRLVEDEIATRTAAEIIMAGYDQQPAKFVGLTDDNDLRGQVALDYLKEPVVGPGEKPSAMLGVLRTVRDCLIDLVTLHGKTFRNLSNRPDITGNDEAAVRRDIEKYTNQLSGMLRMRGNLEGRTIYCVLKLPEDLHERAFRLEVLREVSRCVPKLIFIELAPSYSERESELQELMMEVHARLLPL